SGGALESGLLIGDRGALDPLFFFNVFLFKSTLMHGGTAVSNWKEPFSSGLSACTRGARDDHTSISDAICYFSEWMYKPKINNISVISSSTSVASFRAHNKLLH
ncbi:hypothetical protein ACJX0J_020981, partial [Zea mays]